MASLLHEVHVSRLPLDTPSDYYRNFGAFNISKFSPLTLLSQFPESRAFPNESPQIIVNHPKTNGVSIQYSYNNLQNSSSHSTVELYPYSSLMRTNAQLPGNESKSILKKQQNVRKRDNSLNKERPKSVPCSPRKVDFRPSVIVFHFDSVEGNHVRSESQILTTEPKDRKKFLNRNHSATKARFSTGLSLFPTTVKPLDPSRSSLHIILPQYPSQELPNVRRSSVSYRSSTPIPFFQKTMNQAISPNSDRSRSRSIASVESFPNNAEAQTAIADIDFVFFEDDSCRLWLRFVVNLGAGVSASDVLVKANLAGNRVRIVGTRSCGPQREEFHERCILPMEVDPHMITARMDGNGRLFIEGLIMTQEQKKLSSFRKNTQ